MYTYVHMYIQQQAAALHPSLLIRIDALAVELSCRENPVLIEFKFKWTSIFKPN